MTFRSSKLFQTVRICQIWLKREFQISSSMKKNSGKGISSTAWLKRQRSDPFVKMAHAEGYRARSAYKLLELNRKFRNRLVAPGMAVMECGCAPGAWSQVAVKALNAGGHYSNHQTEGLLIGCDLLYTMPVEGLTFIQRDFTAEETQRTILELLGPRKFDAVLSDMAPNASGIATLDHEKIIYLCYKVLRFALINSYPDGHFLCKIWNGPSQEKLLKDVSSFYREAKILKPKASRQESAEFYIVGFGFKGVET